MIPIKPKQKQCPCCGQSLREAPGDPMHWTIERRQGLKFPDPMVSDLMRSRGRTPNPEKVEWMIFRCRRCGHSWAVD